RLGLAVSELLPEIAPHRVPAPVGDHGSRAEPERLSGVLQAPADVDVVPGGPELLVEAADPLQRRPAEGHVAAGEVLGLAVADQNVDRGPRRGADAFGH